MILILTFTSACAPGNPVTATTPPPTHTAAPPSPSGASRPSLTPTVPSPTSTKTQVPEILHRIGVRVADGAGQFYDRVTGERFTPRGSNLVRLAWQQTSGGDQIYYHSNFNTGLYEPIENQRDLEHMRAHGYNLVRVFLSGACQEACLGSTERGVNPAYVANLVDFLSKARANGIYVLLTTDAEPALGGYTELLDTTWSADFAGTNTLLRQGAILAGARFWRDLIHELRRQNAPMDAIFAYELRNEQFFESNLPPLSLASGKVSTANGKTYDMADKADRVQMLDEGLVFWIDEIRKAIIEADSTALVTASFFAPDQPNPWPSAPRLVRTPPLLWESTIDFVDLHPYPGGYELDKLVENYGFQAYPQKPIL